MRLINFLRKKKNENPYLFWLWTKNRQRKGRIHLKKYNDREAVIRLYKGHSGRLPDLDNPKTFSEKLQWMKLNLRSDLMSTCVDKYEVGNYIRDKGYGNLLPKIYGLYDSVYQIDWEVLPEQFVIKATHGSNWNLIVKDKKEIDKWIWEKVFEIWLDDNIFWPGREWPYKNLKPRLMSEEYLEDKSGGLMDYKIFCFHAEPHFVQVNVGRGTDEHAQNFYDMEWNLLPFGKHLPPNPNIKIAPPSRLHRMAEIAKDLAAPFPFVRVDFYEVDGKIIFGEMTFFPKSGLPDFTLPGYDEKFGKLIRL